jgi:hypothetical protein
MDYRYGNGTTEDAGATFHIGCGGEIYWFKEGPICSRCEASGDGPDRMDTLARNLAVAGGLCAAWQLGFEHAAEVIGDPYQIAPYTWEPGCGRAVR